MIPSHMQRRTQVIAAFTCPLCKTRRRWLHHTFYGSFSLDISSCTRMKCYGCHAELRLPHTESQCKTCERRVDCLSLIIHSYEECMKLYHIKLSNFEERIEKARSRGHARVAKGGNIHKVLIKFFTDEMTRTAKELRHSRMSMWEVMYALVYGFIEHRGHPSKAGTHYNITEVGIQAREVLTQSPKNEGQWVQVPIQINDRWLEYFKWHQW